MANELYHRKDKKDHKYIAKIERGKKTRYFYSKEEWLAYLKGKKNPEEDTKKNEKTLSDLIGNGKKLLTSLFKDIDKPKEVKKTKEPKFSDSIKAAVTKVVNKGQKFVNSVANKVDKAVTKKHVAKGKEYLSDKANESLGALFIIPTDVIVDAIDRLVDAISKDKKKEKEKNKQDNVIEEKYIEQEVIEEKVIEEQIIEEEILKEEKLEEEVIPEWASDLNRQEEELTHDENQALVNPEYDPYDVDYSMNCAYCTAAYDLRLRGYDVEAMPYNPLYVSNIHTIATWYEDTDYTDWNHYTVPENVGKYLDKYAPDGSRGQFCVYWSTGGGHSMTWEREDGKTVIRDCQTNVTMDYDEWVDIYGDYVTDAYTLRTDDRKPTKKILKTVRNREEDDD